jgi:hypothetical protein
MEKGGTETFVPVPLRMGGKMLPVRGPVTDLPPIQGGGSSRKMGDSGIDPTDGIDNIRTIGGDLIANEEILRDRFIHPFFKPTFFVNRPAPIADFPDLIRRLRLLVHRARPFDPAFRGTHGSEHIEGLPEHVVASRMRAKETSIYIVPPVVECYRLDSVYKTGGLGYVPAI